MVLPIIISLLVTLMRGSRRKRHANFRSKSLNKNTHNIDFSDNHKSSNESHGVRNMTNYTE